jgi:hypothetical protein
MGSIAETLLMGIGKQRTSLEARLAGRADAKALEPVTARVASGEPVVLVGLAELVALAEPVVLVGLAVLVALAEPVALVGLAVLVALAEPVVRVGLAVLVALAEPALVQVGAQETKHLAAQLAVVLRTKWVTAAHRRGLVPVLAVEDSAAVAETMRAPAAAEAAAAWVAAG